MATSDAGTCRAHVTTPRAGASACWRPRVTEIDEP